MRINSVKIKDHFMGWAFDEVTFTSNLTLLVGTSGVGKTQILRAIHHLKDISEGQAVNGFEWSVRFSINENKEFLWEGRFSVVETSGNANTAEENSPENKPKIQYELLKDLETGKTVVERTANSITFNGQEMPKLPSSQSTIYTLSEEPLLRQVINSFKKIRVNDNARPKNVHHYINLQGLGALKTFEEIRGSSLSIKSKLLAVSTVDVAVFGRIKARLIDIFPQIENIRVLSEAKDASRTAFRAVISIKERGVPKWIDEANISSGIRRTIFHIADLYLQSKDSVLLIDELENSLGVNCIDILTDDLLHEHEHLQFIATSHHPYIINNIPYEYWKIVRRNGGQISVHDASDYHLGKSKQDAFLQLTKLLERQA